MFEKMYLIKSISAVTNYNSSSCCRFNKKDYKREKRNISWIWENCFGSIKNDEQWRIKEWEWWTRGSRYRQWVPGNSKDKIQPYLKTVSFHSLDFLPQNLRQKNDKSLMERRRRSFNPPLTSGLLQETSSNVKKDILNILGS